MTINIYNTLTRKKEIFEPVEPGKVKMYVCGPTVYDYCHIGHARSVVTFDVVARYLRDQGFDVIYVRNFTDVDDKIIARANERGMDSRELSEEFIRAFYKDMDALNVERADFEPRVTEFIEPIKEFVARLIEREKPTRLTAMCIIPWNPSANTANSREESLKTWKPARGWMWMNGNTIPLILLCGNRQSPGNPFGKVPGEKAVPDGISNARP